MDGVGGSRFVEYVLGVLTLMSSLSAWFWYCCILAGDSLFSS